MNGDEVKAHEVLFGKLEELQKKVGKLENTSVGQDKDLSHLKEDNKRLVFRLDNIERDHSLKKDLERTELDVNKLKEDQKNFITSKGAQILVAIGGLLIAGMTVLASWTLGSSGKP